MNPVLTLTHNCLDLTRRTVESIFSQDIPIDLMVIDNASTDGTREWLSARAGQPGFHAIAGDRNYGVSHGWNWGLQYYFSNREVDYVMVVNNDILLPPWLYRELLSYELPFVTGIPIESMAEFTERSSVLPVKCKPAPCPHFSCFLIRRAAWQQIGPFDERMIHYCGDLDYHVRAHRLGIPLLNAGLPFYHETSSTMHHAPLHERAEIEMQANQDRATFQSIYGCHPNGAKYADLFK